MKNDISIILPPYIRAIVTEAHGKFGGYVLCTRNGRIFPRRHFIPPNPRTAKQQARRALMASAVRHWRRLDENRKLPWKREAAALGRTGYHLFISVFMDRTGRRSGSVSRIQLTAFGASPSPGPSHQGRRVVRLSIHRHFQPVANTMFAAATAISASCGQWQANIVFARHCKPWTAYQGPRAERTFNHQPLLSIRLLVH
ncbi:MAG: hypothetical protein EPN93_03035 [Spirochaetes bacterium]|nr:MAG: hypothetical protein EPN93_03035 [Spirochaetota bacterium]